ERSRKREDRGGENRQTDGQQRRVLEDVPPHGREAAGQNESECRKRHAHGAAFREDVDRDRERKSQQPEKGERRKKRQTASVRDRMNFLSAAAGCISVTTSEY